MNFKVLWCVPLFGLMLTSCSKSLIEDNISSSEVSSAESIARLQPSPKFAEGIAFYEQMKTESRDADSRTGSQFIAAYFNEDGFWFFDGNKSAYFYSELTGNDFYRENPDGTVSVHVTCNNAYGEYDGPEGYAYGNHMHMNVVYNGPVVDYGWFKYIDIYNNNNSVIWHGNGKVQINGSGPKMNMVAHYTQTPGNGQENVHISLN